MGRGDGEWVVQGCVYDCEGTGWFFYGRIASTKLKGTAYYLLELVLAGIQTLIGHFCARFKPDIGFINNTNHKIIGTGLLTDFVFGGPLFCFWRLHYWLGILTA
tara:strand:- start:2 stop:313 length:312 start_codon:yes stop_codon:yes gene_type:complete